MLMRGDLNKIITEVNKVLEGYNERIVALEDEILLLKEAKTQKPQAKQAVKKEPEPETEAA